MPMAGIAQNLQMALCSTAILTVLFMSSPVSFIDVIVFSVQIFPFLKFIPRYLIGFNAILNGVVSFSDSLLLV